MEVNQEKKHIFHLLRFYLSNRNFNGIIVSSLCEHFAILKNLSELLRDITEDVSKDSKTIEISNAEAAMLQTFLLAFENTRQKLLVYNVSMELH